MIFFVSKYVALFAGRKQERERERERQNYETRKTRKSNNISIFNLVWTETWSNGSYTTRVYIYKKVLNRYNSLTVEIICKAHSQNAKAGNDVTEI